jgi:hypothetical protein
MENQKDVAVRYSVALSDGFEHEGTKLVEGHLYDYKNGLLKSEVEQLTAPPGYEWVISGWSNPLAPNNWVDA